MTASLVILGTSGAIQTADRDNTALVLRAGASAVLIDCPGSAALKLRRAGVDLLRLDAVVLTHGHPDHLSGLPSLVHNLWMLQRRAPLALFAPDAEIPRIGRLLELFDLVGRASFLDPRPLPRDAAAAFLAWPGGRLFAHPVDHGPPAFAIRWDAPGGARVCYSADTRPVEALAVFASGAALFVHEATFSEAEAARAHEDGHSTPGQAGRIAAMAGAARLVLVHLAEGANPARWTTEARKTFGGPVDVPADGAVYEIG